MCTIGDCFVVLPPSCLEESVIVGRNAEGADVQESQEVFFYDANEVLEGKADGGAQPDVCADDVARVILQKPRHGVWGGDYGANERNVCVGVTWTSGEPEYGSGSGSLCATDIVRYTLALATSASDAVERIGNLISVHGADDAKLNFIICDSTEAWVVSCGGKLWAAQKFTNGFHRFPIDGLAVTNRIDKSSEELESALKAKELWSGEGDLNFASCFNAVSKEEVAWSGEEPVGDGTFTLPSMFDTLRSAAKAESSRSANVSVLMAKGISCHWFTATPNASESVFKPFVFAPNPKISPLTKVPADNTQTLLHQLHAQRKPAAMENLRALEAACVDEVNSYLAEHLTADEELDELMKDCVEAEVKFYR